MYLKQTTLAHSHPEKRPPELHSRLLRNMVTYSGGMKPNRGSSYKINHQMNLTP